MVTYEILSQFRDIVHYCSERAGGISTGNYDSWNLSPFTGDNAENIAYNLSILCRELNITPQQLIIPFQTHGTEVRCIDTHYFQWSSEEQDNYLHGVDAIVTQLPNIAINVTTADCVPLIFFDPEQKVSAVAHAGWRGTCGRIAEKTIQAMCTNYGSNPTQIHVAIGPSISPDVYEVGPELIHEFETMGFHTQSLFIYRHESLFLDLWEANYQVLTQAGILPSHIQKSGLCTYTQHERFFSARRLGIRSGRILSGIMLRNLDSTPLK